MPMKIKDFLNTKKGSDLVLGILLILSMIVSFLLGRLSKSSENAIIIETPNSKSSEIDPLTYTIENAENKAVESGLGSIVASKRGSKYYFVWCSGSKTLSEANKIYFESEILAQNAGYSLSTSCK